MEGGGGLAHIYGNNISVIVDSCQFINSSAGNFGKGGVFHINSHSGHVFFSI